DLATGEITDELCREVTYEITKTHLEGSWDNRIMVRVMRERFVDPQSLFGYRGPAVRIPCNPYLVVEGSIHKAMIGHNIAAGPLDVAPSIVWFLLDVGDCLGVTFPCPLHWTVERIDWAECFDLGGEAAQHYINLLRSVYYPRRKVTGVDNESVYSS